MDPNNVENPNQEKAPKSRRSGCLVRAAILCLIPFLLVVVLLVTVVWVQAHRTLPEPHTFRPSPLVLAALKAGNGSGSLQPATGKLPARSDGTTTSGTVMSGQGGVTGAATSPVIATPSFELIPERELARPALRDQARQINTSFRQWIDVVRLYEQDPVKFKELPEAKDQPFGGHPPTAYRRLEEQLAKTPLDGAYQKKLSDTCLQLLVHYGDWDSASSLCWHYQQHYRWDETLYAVRQIPKPGGRYFKIVVYSWSRMIGKIVNQPK